MCAIMALSYAISFKINRFNLSALQRTIAVSGVLAKIIAAVDVNSTSSNSNNVRTDAEEDAGIIVSIETGHFLGSQFGGEQKGCPVRCLWAPREREKADALWYHIPQQNQEILKHHPSQLSIVASMESAVNYPSLADKTHMNKFDLKMTYELDSDAIMSYFCRNYMDEVRTIEPVPFEDKLDAVVFLASNCNDRSGRRQIVEKLIELKVPVHARGRCLNNMPLSPRSIPNVKVMKEYKFCVVMENSRAQDYISEKLFEAMKSGCLPIYYGAPNIEDFIPLPDAIIDYEKLGSPEALATKINFLMHNKTAYEEHFRYKKMKLEEMSPRYLHTRSLVDINYSAECQICMVVKKLRSGGKLEQKWRAENSS